MSTIINGNPANITTPLSATITSAAAGSGITTCTTSASHLFGPNDTVTISGDTNSTGIDGSWTITVTGATTFTIPYAISGSIGGTVRAKDSSLSPQILWPSDGDPSSVQLSGLLSGGQALADRTQYLNSHLAPLLGQYSLFSVYGFSAGSAASPAATFFTSGAWASQSAYLDSSAGRLNNVGHSIFFNATDLLEFSFSSTAILTNPSSAISCEAQLALQLNSTSTNFFIPGGFCNISTPAIASAITQVPVSISALYAPGVSGGVGVFVNGQASLGIPPNTFALAYGWSLVVKQYRVIA